MSDGSASPGSTGQTPAGPEQLAVQKCESIIEEYRKAKVSKSRVLITITAALPQSFIEGSTSAAALDSFIEIIESIDQERRDAADRGRGRNDGGHRGGSPHQSEDDDDEGAGAKEPPPPDGRRRQRSESPGRHEYSKKQRVNESFFAWKTDEFLLDTLLSPELKKTNEILTEFAKDPKFVLSSILNVSTISFPESEFSAIIRGQSVNLDRVISDLHTVSFKNSDTVSVGNDVELRFGAAEPTKTVGTLSDWVLAWDRAGEAIVMVFPHRKREIKAYTRYILGIFGGTNPISHYRVINFDKRVRREVARRRDLSLDSFKAFSEWNIQYLTDIGIGANDEKPTPRDRATGGGGSTKKEPCIKYNEERCTRSGSNCRYAHVCSICKRPGHASIKCNSKGSV